MTNSQASREPKPAGPMQNVVSPRDAANQARGRADYLRQNPQAVSTTAYAVYEKIAVLAEIIADLNDKVDQQQVDQQQRKR
jgi:hypothetical protein